MPINLSIIIPAYNEALRIGRLLEVYLPYFTERYGDSVEFIVVINGTTDNTQQVVESNCAKYQQLKVIVETKPIGKGGAVILGMREAQGQWIGYVDADGSTPPEAFQELLDKAEDAPAVIASRWCRGAVVSPRQPFIRRLASRVFNSLTRLLFGLRLTDTQCGAKVFKREVVEAVLGKVGITRWAFDVDLLFQIKRAGFQIREIPTTWHDVEGSKITVTESSLEMLLAIVRMRLVYSPLILLVRLYDITISAPVEYLLRDALFRHTVLLTSAAMVMHICNIAFQMFVGRALPHAEYALLASFLALFAIVVRPFHTLATAMNHYTSILIQEGKQVVLGRLLFKWSVRTAVPSIILSCICVALSPRLAAFFHIERIAPVVVAALALPAIFVMPVYIGIAAGMQRFGLSSISSTVGAFGRVTMGAVFVFAIHPACGWALSGHVGGMYVQLLILFAAFIPILYSKIMPDKRIELPSFRNYLFWSFLVQLSVAVLMTGDVIMVRRYLPADVDFAYAATLSRVVVFFSSTVAIALFPKVATSGTFTREHRSLYLRSLVYAGGFVAISLLLCVLMPGLALRILFGLESPGTDLLRVSRLMGCVMSVSAMLQINVNLLLAQRRFAVLMVTVACALIYLVAVHLWATSTSFVILMAGVTNIIAFIVTTIGILNASSETKAVE